MAGAIVQLPSVSNVTEGSTFTVHCPVGRTYESIHLQMGGTVFQEDDILNLSVNVNGKPIMTFGTGTELRQINDFYGRPDQSAHIGANSGTLDIYFRRPELLEQFRNLTALGTQDVDTLTITGDLSGTTSPTLTAHAVLGRPAAMGAITKVRRFPVTFSTSGQQEIDRLPMGPRIIAVHLFKSDISDVEVEADGVKIVDASKDLLNILQENEGRVPVTGSATHVDFCLDGDLRNALVTQGLQDFRLRPTLDTSGAVTAVVEYLDGFAGL